MLDWILGLVGGLMIGGAAAALLLANGRIMGASGLVGGLIDASGWDAAGERLAFLAGLVGVPALIALAAGARLETGLTDNLTVVVIGGLMVGLGTRLANGCTSGHGVCGLSRLSLRGIVATLLYLAAGMVTVAVLRHGLGLI